MKLDDGLHTWGIGMLVLVIGFLLGGLILAFDHIMLRPFMIGPIAFLGLVVALALVIIGWAQISFWMKK